MLLYFCIILQEVKKAIFDDLFNVGKRDGLSSLEIVSATF